MKYTSACCVFVLCFLLHFVLITSYIAYDESNFLSLGWFMSQKEYRLYSHSNDNKMPLAYIPIHFVGLVFSGVEMILYSRLLAILFYSLIAGVVCFIVIDLFKSDTAGFFSGIVFSLLSASNYTIGYTYITFVMLSQLLLFYFLTKERWFFSGLVFAFSLLTIQTSVFMLPLVAYRLLWSRNRIRDVVLLCGGCIVVSAFVLGYMIFFTNLSNFWYNVFEYNLLPVSFPNSSLGTKSFVLSGLFDSNAPLCIVCLCSLGFLLGDSDKRGWIGRGITCWVLSIILMIFILNHMWSQYSMYFFTPFSLIFGWFFTTLKEDRVSVLLVAIVLFFLVHNFVVEVKNVLAVDEHNMVLDNLFIDVVKSYSFSGCSSLYLIGNEDGYVVSGLSPPQKFISGRFTLFLDSWSLWTRNREMLLDYGVVDSLLSKVDCVAIVPPASNDMEVMGNPNIPYLLDRNGFVHQYNMSYGGFLWKK